MLHADGNAALARQIAIPAPPRRTGRAHELQAQLDKLLGQMRVAVIYGGDKSIDGAVIHQTINTRSWKSYQSVAEDIAASLERIGCKQVFILPEDMRLGERLRDHSIHMAWLNTGGVQGYNPMCHASAMLEMLGVPYVGHDPLTASVLDNKHSFKRDLLALGLPTATFMTWHPGRGPLVAAEQRRFQAIFGDYSGPFIVKPVSGRASQHVHLVEDTQGLTAVVDEIYEKTHNHILIEKYLSGREFCIAVCGPVVARGRKLERSAGPFVFGAVERMLDSDEKIFTSMDVRPITVDRVRALDQDADAAILAGLAELATEVYCELGLETLVRLDVRADDSGKLYLLESNPKPDLKAPTEDKTSLVVASLARYGMDYDDLILSLLADRIDLLFSQRRGCVTHLTSLLE
ncbi:MAG: hypothetical protein MI920_01385 [Kiloniellales bacterium]|nr:hypothetical protein [Kiloniellales bacterium]